ncbi:PREDICTED: uncharacterized protein LOC105955721 [Erythranthe guttata]|uniref:uncharacterized protein LOC105955721 n=1 Tax=Erythranthe guttata TaxID=4155 RepID=UPI00064D754D|nr:PREDICTED: uncharacterized protein LOC105955721 [Erythranthe guttata]|eukprot:XP_012834968.1 PREDICTED: uncharacterized protein LOC105955721 [Erythranthe guttata]
MNYGLDFVKRSQVKMENMRNELNQNESITSEREIVNKVLGKRSGYEKGLGYGVVPSKCSKRSTCESSQLETFQEKLSVTEDELKDATCRIKSQQELIQTQEALIQNYDDRCKKQDDEIQGLREGQDELKQMLLRLLQQNSSSNQDKL